MEKEIEVKFELHDCPTCGFQFMLPESFVKRRREDGRSFYCPSSCNAFSGINVHSMSFPIQKKEVPKVEYKIKEVIKEVESPKLNEAKQKIKSLEPRGRNAGESPNDYQKYMRNFNKITKQVLKQF